jgi:hypothetical protein
MVGDLETPAFTPERLTCQASGGLQAAWCEISDHLRLKPSWLERWVRETPESTP